MGKNQVEWYDSKGYNDLLSYTKVLRCYGI